MWGYMCMESACPETKARGSTAEARIKMMKKYTMGIDLGTGGVRVGLFTLRGEALVFSTTDVKSHIHGPGMTEQEPFLGH